VIRKKRKKRKPSLEGAEIVRHAPTKEDRDAIIEILERLRNPTDADWDEAIGNIKRGGYLDDKAFRLKIEQLARELEREGREAHRDADRLEVLSYFHWKANDVRVSQRSRSAIEARLSRWWDPKKDLRYFHFIDFMLDRLVETGLRADKQLRQQAATLLDAAEHIDDELASHAHFVKEARRRRKSKKSKKSRNGRRRMKSTDGRDPSRMKAAVISLMIAWDVSPEEMYAQLDRRGIRRWQPETLKVERWRRNTA